MIKEYNMKDWCTSMLFICLSVFSGLAAAENKAISPIVGCEAPKTLMGLTIVFATDPNYAPYNPFADVLLEMSFSVKSYTFNELQGMHSFSGGYFYRKLAQNVGVLTGKDIVGPKLLRYSIVFVCKSREEGHYIFSQEQGENLPDINQNMGTYVIMSTP
ncbi:hypothetical protein [Shewanella surugensis]|uniref:Uncharacterized protein n=1 Tax=Shewanella surugensis TaxID=212020 RepID=A0ABT0LHN0_9GAMM|nr:hypothetical protein [Shewanella surugensis]MCL1127074.1 hypothetical protein [Shewanella surugensis]